MCFHKTKKGRPLQPPTNPSATERDSGGPLSRSGKLAKQKSIAAAAAPPPGNPKSLQHSQPKGASSEQSPTLQTLQKQVADKSVPLPPGMNERTCVSDRSDNMAISVYKHKVRDKRSSGNGSSTPQPAPVADKGEDSPEVFENNAQVVSLNPVNVTQIFVDSIVPQTNYASRPPTDIVDQNTLENVDNYIDDMIFDPLDSDMEHFAEIPRARPLANVLQPEDDTLVDTMSDTHRSVRETRPKFSRHRESPLTPDRVATQCTVATPTQATRTTEGTPPVPTQQTTVNVRALTTAKRLSRRGPRNTTWATSHTLEPDRVSTRTAAIIPTCRTSVTTPAASRRQSVSRRVKKPASCFDDDADLDATAPSRCSRERVTIRTLRPTVTETKTAQPIRPAVAAAAQPPSESGDTPATAVGSYASSRDTVTAQQVSRRRDKTYTAYLRPPTEKKE